MTQKTVVVANTGEAFRHETLQMRTDHAREHQKRFDQSLGERGLFWAGDDKLVITAQPTPKEFLLHVRDVMGYHRLETLNPDRPSLCLSEDIWRERALFREVVAFCGSDPIDLMPFASTVQFLDLVDRLRMAGVQVNLPESPTRANLWVRNHLDTKAGFRSWGLTLSHRLRLFQIPQGFVCRDDAEVADIIHWFLDRRTKCVVKASQGAGGEGLMIFDPAIHSSDTISDTMASLRANPYFRDDQLVVEELVATDPSVAGGSPSVDVYIPPLGQGDPEILCLSGQVLAENGEFIGVEIRHDIVPASLAHAIKEDSLSIARSMAAIGYVGPFDIDLVVAPEGSVYMVEFNMRRTGGSHAIDIGRYLYGPDYASKVTILSANKPLAEGGRISYPALHATLADLVYPMGSRKAGLILTNVSLLNYGSFGYVILAPETHEAYALREEVVSRAQALTRNTHVVSD
jgi:hypothetical protein